MTERLLICTDLDRTLIPNGPQSESPEARAHFAALAGHDEVTLAFVTGRHRVLVEVRWLEALAAHPAIEQVPALSAEAKFMAGQDVHGLIQQAMQTALPQEEFRNLAAAASLALLVMLLALNAVAVILRNRYSRRMM